MMIRMMHLITLVIEQYTNHHLAKCKFGQRDSA